MLILPLISTEMSYIVLTLKLELTNLVCPFQVQIHLPLPIPNHDLSLVISLIEGYLKVLHAKST